MAIEQRKCSTCEKTKALTEFARSYKKNKTPEMLSFYRYRCKECQRVRWRERDRERNRTEYFKKRDQSPAKKEYIKKRDKKRAAEGYYKEKWVNTSPAERKRHARQAKYRKYGLTNKEFAEMLKAQDNACAICGRVPKGREKALAVDHDHDTGKVRSLLCGRCNMGLGYFQDDSALLKKAQAYLRKFKE
jgi:hypothetical protein